MFAINTLQSPLRLGSLGCSCPRATGSVTPSLPLQVWAVRYERPLYVERCSDDNTASRAVSNSLCEHERWMWTGILTMAAVAACTILAARLMWWASQRSTGCAMVPGRYSHSWQLPER
jgi:hypothetical protein